MLKFEKARVDRWDVGGVLASLMASAMEYSLGNQNKLDGTILDYNLLLCKTVIENRIKEGTDVHVRDKEPTCDIDNKVFIEMLKNDAKKNRKYKVGKRV